MAFPVAFFRPPGSAAPFPYPESRRSCLSVRSCSPKQAGRSLCKTQQVPVSDSRNSERSFHSVPDSVPVFHSSAFPPSSRNSLYHVRRDDRVTAGMDRQPHIPDFTVPVFTPLVSAARPVRNQRFAVFHDVNIRQSQITLYPVNTHLGRVDSVNIGDQHLISAHSHLLLILRHLVAC